MKLVNFQTAALLYCYNFSYVKPVKSDRQKLMDAMLDRLDKVNLLVFEGAMKEILRMKEEKDKGAF